MGELMWRMDFLAEKATLLLQIKMLEQQFKDLRRETDRQEVEIRELKEHVRRLELERDRRDPGEW